jgi:hypothetical protein
VQQLESYIHGGRTHIGVDVPKHWTGRQRGRHGPVEADLRGAAEVAQKQAAINHLIEGGATRPEVQGEAHLRAQVRALGELTKSVAAALSIDSDDFDELAEDWKQATAFVSSPEETAMHPSYQRIIGMGTTVLPRILEALEQEPDQWFWALRAIVGRDVAEDATTIAGAASAWVEWGRSLGLIGQSSR